jgi:hypothetical protein
VSKVMFAPSDAAAARASRRLQFGSRMAPGKL